MSSLKPINQINQYRFAFFVSFSSLSTAFSGLLATACSYLNGLGHPALAGFRWLFILEGGYIIRQ